ncbi:MAG: hypothetical protein GC188_09540 [Alphaproteobacteria bacterium]|nr:hypothetical protein [Alphaproteobacteria bacterium]
MPGKNYDSFFSVEARKPQTKADITDAAVREILREESGDRAALSAKLRKLRLARDKTAGASAPKKPSKPARPRQAR